MKSREEYAHENREWSARQVEEDLKKAAEMTGRLIGPSYTRAMIIEVAKMLQRERLELERPTP